MAEQGVRYGCGLLMNDVINTAKETKKQMEGHYLNTLLPDYKKLEKEARQIKQDITDLKKVISKVPNP